MRRIPGRASVTALVLVLFPIHAAAEDAPADNPVAQPVNINRAVTSGGTVDPSGAFATEIPLTVPEYRKGLTPQLSLSYRSSRSNGFVGVGWSIAGLSTIERASPGKGSPNYDATDVYLLDGEPLVISAALGGTHARLRQDFRRITKASTNWTITETDGRVSTYKPVYATSGGTLRWGLSSVADPHGNTVNYTWACEDGDCYPSTVSYNHTTITFYRESRPSAEYETFATGAGLGATQKRLRSIDIVRNGARVRAYKLSYDASDYLSRSLLVSVQEFGRDCVISNGAITGGTAWPALTFSYGAEQTTLFQNSATITSSWGMTSAKWTTADHESLTGDFNGDGRTDILLRGAASTYLLTATSSGGFDTAVNITTSYGMSGARWSPAERSAIAGDFNGDGLTDILLQVKEAGNSYLLTARSSGGFDTVEDITSSFGMTGVMWSGSQRTAVSGDFDGDGRTDVILQGQGITYLLAGSSSDGFETMEDVTSSWGMTGPTWSRLERTAIAADFTGDGRTDILLQGDGISYLLVARSSGGFFTVDEVTNSYGMSATKWNRLYQTGIPADFNGDGRSDLLLQGKSNSYLLIADGSGGFEDVENITSLYGMSATLWTTNYRQAAPGDFNGDGKFDLLLRGPGSANLLIADGSGGFKNRLDVTSSFGMTSTRWSVNYQQSIFGDFGGDGKTDIIQRGTANTYQLTASAPWTDNLLTSMTNGYGSTTTVGYAMSSAWTNTGAPPLMPTVTSVAVSDGRGNTSTSTFSYSGGAWDPVERRLLGFRYIKEVDPSGAYTETYYYQGAAYSVGEVEQTYRKNASGATMSRTWRTVANPPNVADAAPYRRLLLREDNYECNGDTSCKTAAKTFGYDGYGNVTTLTELGDTSVTGDERTTRTVYYPNKASYLVSYPADITLRAGTAATGVLLSQRRFYYDGSATLSTPPAKGDANRIEQWLDTGARWLAETATYDSYGNRLTQTDALGRTTTTTYDTTYNLHPVSVTNAAGHTTTKAWLEVCSQPSSETDPNDASTSWTYDNLCRRTLESRPDGSSVSWAYTSFGSPSAQHVKETLSDGTVDGLWKATYFDGRGREYKKVAEPSITEEIGYDLRGNVASTTAPYFTGETRKTTSYTYDALNRLTQTTHPDASTVKNLYGDWSVTTCDELGKPRSSYKDAYDQVRRVREYTDKTCVVAPACTLGTNCFDTSTTYDLVGRKIAVTDAVGNTASYTFDSANRRTSMTDPDLGTWTYGYDDVGNQISQTDAKGQFLSFEYDALDRLTARKHGATWLAEFQYDEAGYGASIGRLTSMWTETDTTRRTYDSMGRVIREQRIIGSGTFVITSTYDAAGRPSGYTYPGGEVVGITYDNAGRQATLGAYVSAATYDARGNLTGRTLGNGVSETLGWDANRGWLTSVSAVKNGVTLVGLTFARNLRGDLTSRTNSLDARDNQTYTHDDLRRLLTATHPSIPAWNESFTYDAIGRIKTATSPGTYTYPAAGLRPQHAPKTAGAWTSFSYDANGGLLSGAGHTIAYDVENRPILVDGQSVGYDAEGARVKAGSRVQLPLFDFDLSTGATTKYYYFNKTRIARRDNATSVYYYHGDQIGSVARVTNGSGEVVSTRLLTAFGRTREVTGPLENSFALAAARLESGGLYEMGARYMNSELGMFVAPDPSGAPDSARPQSLNRFAYVSNSPTRLIDPTGFVEEIPIEGSLPKRSNGRNGRFRPEPPPPSPLTAERVKEDMARLPNGGVWRAKDGTVRVALILYVSEAGGTVGNHLIAWNGFGEHFDLQTKSSGTDCIGEKTFNGPGTKHTPNWKVGAYAATEAENAAFAKEYMSNIGYSYSVGDSNATMNSALKQLGVTGGLSALPFRSPSGQFGGYYGTNNTLPKEKDE